MQRYSGIKEFVAKCVSPDSQVLSVGSGTSMMTEEMHDEGITHITDIDTSDMAVQIMKERYEDNEKTALKCNYYLSYSRLENGRHGHAIPGCLF